MDDLSLWLLVMKLDLNTRLEDMMYDSCVNVVERILKFEVTCLPSPSDLDFLGMRSIAGTCPNIFHQVNLC